MEGSAEFNIGFSPLDVCEKAESFGDERNIAGQNYQVLLVRSGGKISVSLYLTDWKKYLLYHGYYSCVSTLVGHIKKTKSLVQGSNLLSCHNSVMVFSFLIDEQEAWFTLNLRVIVEDFYVYALSSPIPHFAESPMQVNDKKIYVSKAILSAQSPFFAELFNSGDEVQIHVATPRDFRVLLHFLYGIPVSLQRHPDSIPALLELVDRFQCPIAKLAIEQKLEEFRPSDLKKFLEEIDQCGMRRLAKKIVDSFTGEELRKFREEGDMFSFSASTVDAFIIKLMSQMQL
uniref:BTB domain-containing protein n=1 Tax=Steinernema glaseri TaxID=37863 RepID=A0A1I7ZL53_9BILA